MNIRLRDETYWHHSGTIRGTRRTFCVAFDGRLKLNAGTSTYAFLCFNLISLALTPFHAFYIPPGLLLLAKNLLAKRR